MVPVEIAGNISGEATAPSGNILMRQRDDRLSRPTPDARQGEAAVQGAATMRSA